MAPNAANLRRVKDGFRSVIKRFGPLILTGLAAVAEHHWLDRKDESQDGNARESPDDLDERHPIRKLEREIADLKRSLSRKHRDEEGGRDAGPAPRIRKELDREWRSPHQEGQSNEPHARSRVLGDEGPKPSSYHPRQQHVMAGALGDEREGPIPYQQYQPQQTIQQMQTPQQAGIFVPEREGSVEREYTQPSHRQHSMHRRRRRHRRSSVPHRTSYGAAALAGAVEAIHVANTNGDWVGRKGMRVGTTMAASYAASRSRNRGRGSGKAAKWEVAVDVGTGLLVSELVHGSAKRVEEDEER